MKKTFAAGMVSMAAVLTLTGCFNNAESNTDGTPPPSGSVQSAQGPSAASAGVPWIATKNTTRINAGDPAEAAVLVSRTLWPATGDDNRPGGIILADPDDWRAALASADLIHHPNNGPILFVNREGIPDVTWNEIKRLKPTGVPDNDGVQVILMGDLDPKVGERIKELGLKTDAIAGGNPPAIAKVIDAYYAKATKEYPASVIVGSMDDAEYTMPAVNWIAHMPEPLLYVSKDEVPQETAEALKMREGKANIYILGPESVVSADVQKQLEGYGKVVRIAGDDPYSNAVAFARYSDPATGFGWGITTPGHNFSFVDKGNIGLALAAAPFSHLGKHAPLLWTDRDRMPDEVMAYVMSVQPKYKASPTEGPYNHAWLTGGESDLTAAAQGEIDSMLEIVSESGAGHGSHGGGSAPQTTPQDAEEDEADGHGMHRRHSGMPVSAEQEKPESRE